YERQGSGQALMLIAGSTGDAGNFTRSAALWADEFTVVTYDRRGNARSERPKGWTTTSVSEQADDVGGIIEALQLQPAVIFGASAGGPIALDLMIRHPRLVRAGILQDPAIFSILPDPSAALAPRRALIQETLKAKGPRATVEALVAYLNDDRVLTAVPADILERMLGNADTILYLEASGFASWQPSRSQLADLEVPVMLMVARDTLPIYRSVVEWLAAEIKVEPITVPGRHAFLLLPPRGPRRHTPSNCAWLRKELTCSGANGHANFRMQPTVARFARYGG